jgi:hypothetical protein
MVLKGYKKIGKRFVSPWNTSFPGMREASYTKFSIPELLWLAALNEVHGWQEGARVGLAVVEALSQCRMKERRWFSYTSMIETIPSDERSKIISGLDQDITARLEQGLGSFCRVYPRFPIGIDVFGYGNIPSPDREHIQFIKDLISKVFAKRSETAIKMQGNAVYNAFISGKLRVASGTSLANFPEIQNYPNTEESKKIGASVCAIINLQTGFLIESRLSGWVKYFWNRGLFIEPITFDHIGGNNGE